VASELIRIAIAVTRLGDTAGTIVEFLGTNHHNNILVRGAFSCQW
jgi:hypothetical protein